MSNFDYLGYAFDSDEALLTTIISQKTSAASNFHTAEGVLVLGSVLGNITSLSGLVLIADSGVIKGRVASEKLIVAGVVYGDIFARQEVVLIGEAEVHGNIFCPNKTVLSEDCYVSGRILKAHRTIEQFSSNQMQA